MHRNRHHLVIRGFSDQKNQYLNTMQKMQICKAKTHFVAPDIGSSGELENILTTNYK